MAAHLSSGKVNLGLLRDFYRKEFLDCLDKCMGTKALVWDDQLTGPFGLIAEYSLLKEHEVEKMFPLQGTALPPSNVHNIIFVSRPRLELMDQVAQSVLQEEQKGGFRKDFHIIFVPRKSLLCEKRLKEAGVYGTFANVEEFNLELIPFDNDLLSMEMKESFRECYLENDHTTMFYAARSLMTLQALYGTIPNIHGKGDCARQVVDMMLRMRREMAGREPQIPPQIDNLLILDRNVDLLTPLLSQLTYEGLIDEIFGLSNTSVKLPPEKFNRSNQKEGGVTPEVSTEPKKFILNSSDELYADLRDKNFNAVGAVVSKKAKAITAQFDERHTAKTVSEMKTFVSKLPHLQGARQSLATHTSIAELIKEVTNTDQFMDTLRCQQEFINGIETDKPHSYVEDCIAKEESIVKVLRLVCIQSYCNNGLKPKVLEYYKREILQTYGFEHLITIMNLEKAGLIRPHGNRSYPVIRKSLKLIVEDVNEMNPNDISYVFSGFAPLSVRMAQFLARPGWRSITEVLNLLPGPTIEEVQQIPVALRKRRSSITSSHSSTSEQKITLVYFLGGVTFAEIAAFRFLSLQDDGGTDYIVATTKIINGTNWIESCMEKLEPKKLNPF
ncbi:vacuolar protein sorting-associated protein 33A-like [Liolophura sinensis]|uniref:vacuolar protein sorting-associated protein 33A-like n=1 Tax=Liolophura sinensis TaxID=3198878 RepID=UPI0031593B22